MSRKTKKDKARKRKQQIKKQEEQRQIEDIKRKKETAMAFLELWYTDRKSWRFNKNHQSWLLKHMFNQDRVDALMFKILKKYIQSVEGKSRDGILESAKAVLEKGETELEPEDFEDSRPQKAGLSTTEADLPDEVQSLRALKRRKAEEAKKKKQINEADIDDSFKSDVTPAMMEEAERLANGESVANEDDDEEERKEETAEEIARRKEEREKRRLNIKEKLSRAAQVAKILA
mmetsp:Transcript_20475/g.23200  ORF Transcript_20475/g.23200 Transcript_20475/m.23200 type:complete len:232 (-) Transcript_20475:177-872(-)|eukprot:CAMPEP_0114985966 /NCGR_PEP_ID=MMETSP0216-20121206/8168_1 /TAXON_ID=223996 /ORGANISM="Protocruzia adherens, Strain Boccale" /LENGTH=231 /DNA_ID=CAMNT_0002348357 /DNA_START=92 /DNA_END=787 /DNA_ORIENTATION=-